MVHLLQGCSLVDPRLSSMFADRKRLFVDLMGWDVAVVDDRYEIDQFDGPDATYLIAAAGDEHIASMRLLAGERPHILSTLFADLCDGAVPAGPGVAEITRLCLPCRLGAARRLAVRNCLISAMVDHALRSGIATLTGVVTASFLAQILVMGWRCERLGIPRDHAGQSLGAFRIDLDGETPARLAATGIYMPDMIATPLRRAA